MPRGMETSRIVWSSRQFRIRNWHATCNKPWFVVHDITLYIGITKLGINSKGNYFRFHCTMYNYPSNIRKRNQVIQLINGKHVYTEHRSVRSIITSINLSIRILIFEVVWIKLSQKQQYREITSAQRLVSNKHMLLNEGWNCFCLENHSFTFQRL